MNAVIIQDTREQLGYGDEFSTMWRTGTLPTGDYSIEVDGYCYADMVAIERKELGDLVGCLTVGRDRFERELARGKDMILAGGIFLVMVEASFNTLVRGDYRSKMNPNSAVQSIMAFWARYGTPFLFAGNRDLGRRATESLLLKWARERERGSKC